MSAKKVAPFTVTAATTTEQVLPESSRNVIMRVSRTGGTPDLTFKQVSGGTDFPLEVPAINGTVYELVGAYSVTFGATGTDVEYAISFA